MRDRALTDLLTICLYENLREGHQVDDRGAQAQKDSGVFSGLDDLLCEHGFSLTGRGPDPAHPALAQSLVDGCKQARSPDAVALPVFRRTCHGPREPSMITPA